MLNCFTNFFSLLAVYMVFTLGWYNASWHWVEILISNVKMILISLPFIKFLAVFVFLNCSWLPNFFMLLAGLCWCTWILNHCIMDRSHLWKAQCPHMTDGFCHAMTTCQTSPWLYGLHHRLFDCKICLDVGPIPLCSLCSMVTIYNSLYNNHGCISGSMFICCRYSWALLA